ncbi:Short-chain dehydrogenase TIC 32, chloroplastic [Stylosanthes scabra]|uniref:Short-chain dehydrogenase TIC 32, chloroplastic n=1 Tax=Stylosanthes scabra TaxID=79078 RepID=A0ABU6SHF5_9FABA|nr:Short-chain dehydrogenase TIC 32, chloroplastic [Stylosanthes scabra]
MWPFSRKGASGFSSSSTTEQVTDGIYATGLTAIVTGANSGIGSETARVLAMRGVHVIMGVRNVNSAQNVKESILKEIPSGKIDIMELDLSSMESVRKFALQFNSSGLPLNILILVMPFWFCLLLVILRNNAGIYDIPFMLSKDNIELQFATNHLGPFLLTSLLLDTMKKTAHESKKEGRIVNVSSVGHRIIIKCDWFLFDKINDQSSYWGGFAYAQSKLANILHANELARRFKEDGVNITANSVHPGAVVTNLFSHISVTQGVVNKFLRFICKNIEQGAATTCYVALHPQVSGISGEYFADSNLAQASSVGRDIDLAKKLWDFSMNLTQKNTESPKLN